MHSLLLVLVAFIAAASADTPANCTYEDIRGHWLLLEGPRGNNNQLKCDDFPEIYQLRVQMLFPDVVVDEFGNEGFWTLIYNQGFEIVITGRKYFVFSNYTQDGDNVTSYCDRTMNGWSHNVLTSDWACFKGFKQDFVKPKHHTVPKLTKGKLQYLTNKDHLEKINSVQTMWRAAAYPQFEKMTRDDMLRMAGGPKSRIYGKVKPAPVTPDVAARASQLPGSFDWRNVSGVNFVSPVRNQASCGSCYAFASAAIHEARVRIRSGNTMQPVFSTQDIVECSEYAQGCEGGFPYLIAGKYAEDFGLVEESCNPYKGVDGNCSTDPTCQRHYSTNYRYIGGFYGGCNEPLMRLSLVNNGPIAVSFEVLSDFFNYKGGIYIHSNVHDSHNFGFNPFELTNHVVLIVGYGEDDATKTPFWIVKNSWSAQWGEEGFFRIVRGVDEVSMESLAMEMDPIL